jgi:hypothetical protein
MKGAGPQLLENHDCPLMVASEHLFAQGYGSVSCWLRLCPMVPGEGTTDLFDGFVQDFGHILSGLCKNWSHFQPFPLCFWECRF